MDGAVSTGEQRKKKSGLGCGGGGRFGSESDRPTKKGTPGARVTKRPGNLPRYK